ncbi:MAG: sensor histidine kinase, partial [Planctomycetota bacterium]
EDILNISRIESGLVKVSKETHSLALVIRDSVEMIASYAQEKNITVHSPASILYDQVNIDRDMISQVVINLLSNAVKYTPAGGEITVRTDLNEIEGQVAVTITDTGVGIPAEDSICERDRVGFESGQANRRNSPWRLGFRNQHGRRRKHLRRCAAIIKRKCRSNGLGFGCKYKKVSVYGWEPRMTPKKTNHGIHRMTRKKELIKTSVYFRG